MKTKAQIEQRIKTLRTRKVELNKQNNQGLWSGVVAFAQRSDLNKEIQVLEWVLSDHNEPETINITEPLKQIQG
jgi:hypothetical protein